MSLYTYWRSHAMFGVRVVMNLKGLEAAEVDIQLEKGDQYTDAHPLMVTQARHDPKSEPKLNEPTGLQWKSSRGA